MKIRVEKTHNYTVMSNYHLFDKRLSFKAKGLLSFMLAVPDTWEFSIKGLAAMAKDGVDSVASTIKEMEKYGYVSRRQIRNDRGSFKDVEYTIYECPIDNGNGGDNGSNISVPSDSENSKISEENERTEDNTFSGQRKDKPENKKKNFKQAESRQISGT
ncbi:MAG: helix-turn-helix domain-containing protein, partial [Eubacterium sp.]|nr:helix-turn-helix domain-containing protein [Eubacterium sp.]